MPGLRGGCFRQVLKELVMWSKMGGKYGGRGLTSTQLSHQAPTMQSLATLCRKKLYLLTVLRLCSRTDLFLVPSHWMNPQTPPIQLHRSLRILDLQPLCRMVQSLIFHRQSITDFFQIVPTTSACMPSNHTRREVDCKSVDGVCKIGPPRLSSSLSSLPPLTPSVSSSLNSWSSCHKLERLRRHTTFRDQYSF